MSDKPKDPSDINIEIAIKIACFKTTFVPYPKHVELHERFDYLQQLGRHTRGHPQMGLRALAPSGSGKSTAAEAYMIRALELRPPRGKAKPIIKVDLERATTSKTLMISMLNQMGDAYSAAGNEFTLKLRVLAALKRLETELVIVDEVQHLIFRNGLKSDVTDTLKGMLDTGTVPMVFLGTDDAEPLFKSNIQLNGRLLAPCDLKPLNPKSPGDRDLFISFVARLEQNIVELGILSERSDFNQLGLMPKLFVISSGVIGRISRLFMVALELALLRGAHKLEPVDLAWATETWAIENKFVDHNPLREWLDG